MSELIKVERKDDILFVTLNRAPAHNALSEEMMLDLTKIFKGLQRDKLIKAVLLRGDGPSFCAGGDLNWMRRSLKFSLKQNENDTQKLSDMFEAIFRSPMPLIAQVHGSVMGGGLGLVAVCDIVAAESETKFSFSEVKLGLVPSIISPYILRKIPEAHARPLMLTAETFNAEHAARVNLVHHVGTVDSCASFVQTNLDLISKNGPEATRITKKLIDQVITLPWQKARTLTVKTIAQRRACPEGQEGMTAFFEKRKPNWTKP